MDKIIHRGKEIIYESDSSNAQEKLRHQQQQDFELSQKLLAGISGETPTTEKNNLRVIPKREIKHEVSGFKEVA
jgi:hypothetical protein